MNDQKKLRDIIDAIEAIEAYSVSSYAEFFTDALYCTTHRCFSPLFELFFNSLIAFAAYMASKANEGYEMAYSDA